MSTESITSADQFLTKHPITEFVCATLAEVQEQSASRCPPEAGWTILPCDELSRGRVGVLAFRLVDTKTGLPHTSDFRVPTGELVEETETFHYEPWGPRTTRNQVLTQDNLVEEVAKLRVRKQIYCCDDPQARLIGFVHFDEPGIASVTYLPLTLIKDMDHKPEFVAWRASLPRNGLERLYRPNPVSFYGSLQIETPCPST
jgi:hypothetical protein